MNIYILLDGGSYHIDFYGVTINQQVAEEWLSDDTGCNGIPVVVKVLPNGTMVQECEVWGEWKESNWGD